MFNFLKSPERQKSDYQLKVLSNIDRKSVSMSASFLNTAFDMSASEKEKQLMEKMFSNRIQAEITSILIATQHILSVGSKKIEFNPVLSVALLLYLANAVDIRIPDLSLVDDDLRNMAKEVDRKYRDIVTDMHEQTKNKSSDWQYGSFDQWYGVYLNELKRIDKDNLVDGLHYAELMDDEPLRNAFQDRQCPKKIAAEFVKHSSTTKKRI